MTKRSAVLMTFLLLVCIYLLAQAQMPSTAAKPKKKPSDVATSREVAQIEGRPTIDTDGAVETVMPDGSKRLKRPGVCGYVTIFPDGRRSAVSCMQTQPADPPLPDEVSANWLEKHNSYLLDIIRSLVGNDEASVNNYLRKDEPATATVYDKIRLRTDLIGKLTQVQ